MWRMRILCRSCRPHLTSLWAARRCRFAQSTTSRRTMKTLLALRVLYRVGTFTLGVLALSVGTSPARAQDQALERAKAILRATPILDPHNALPWVIREKAPPPRDVEAFDVARWGR